MSVEPTERADFYVYAYRIGGVMAYVGKGSGYRVNKHLKASHNAELSEWIALAREQGRLVQHRVLQRGLSKRDALRLEGRCFEKWRRSLCNRIHPYPALDWEVDPVQEAQDIADAEAMLGCPTQRLEAYYAFDEGNLSREEALEYGFVDEAGNDLTQ